MSLLRPRSAVDVSVESARASFRPDREHTPNSRRETVAAQARELSISDPTWANRRVLHDYESSFSLLALKSARSRSAICFPFCEQPDMEDEVLLRIYGLS